jgi:hypothetical protein
MSDQSQQPAPDAAALPGTVFGLKKEESELLIFVKAHQDAIFSAILSTIAHDRLAYQVTEQTQFALMDGMTKIRISERPQADNPPPPSPTAGKSPIQTAQ